MDGAFPDQMPTHKTKVNSGKARSCQNDVTNCKEEAHKLCLREIPVPLLQGRCTEELFRRLRKDRTRTPVAQKLRNTKSLTEIPQN